MMKHRALSGSIVLSVGLVCGLFAACAGETIPDVDDELITSVEAVYAGGAGGNGQGGSDDDDDDDRGNGGRGGSAAASAAGAAGAGDDDNSGGAAGSAVASAGAAGAAGAAGDGPVLGGGSGGSGAVATPCDGFPIIQQNCGTGSCHGTGSNLGTFAASEDELIAIIGEEGTICAGRGPLVDPADPDGCVLIQ